MENTAVYSPINNLVSPWYDSGNIAATAFALSIVYNPINTQAHYQMLQEPEDPPEALHLPWGVWIHRRDPLHSIHQKYDTAHLLRTARVSEDILHYAHYTPIIEWPDHENAENSHNAAISYSSKLEYEQFDGHKVYGIGLGGQNEFSSASFAKIGRSSAKKILEEGNTSQAAKELKNAEELDEMPAVNSPVKAKSDKLNNHASANPELEARIITMIIEQIVNLKLFKGNN